MAIRVSQRGLVTMIEYEFPRLEGPNMERELDEMEHYHIEYTHAEVAEIVNEIYEEINEATDGLHNPDHLILGVEKFLPVEAYLKDRDFENTVSGWLPVTKVTVIEGDMVYAVRPQIREVDQYLKEET